MVRSNSQWRMLTTYWPIHNYTYCLGLWKDVRRTDWKCFSHPSLDISQLTPLISLATHSEWVCRHNSDRGKREEKGKEIIDPVTSSREGKNTSPVWAGRLSCSVMVCPLSLHTCTWMLELWWGQGKNYWSTESEALSIEWRKRSEVNYLAYSILAVSCFSTPTLPMEVKSRLHSMFYRRVNQQQNVIMKW